ncbi:MAG: glycyl-radical enzyme activating protein [Promethearchaeota archaeon]
MNGIIFDIQNYAVYDGPGIRTLVFFKGCPLSCQWCQNPESQKIEPEISYFSEKCTVCGTCVKICPNNALRLFNDKVLRDTEKCVVCGKCVEVCPNEVMEIIGKECSADDIVDIVSADKPFYDNSGGGVTITGGEATIQPRFLFELLSLLKKQGIHTAIETCGYFKDDLIHDLIENVDLFLYDIKHIDSDLHKKFTNVSNEKIIANFEKILNLVSSDRLVVRIPIIPRVNTDLKIIKKIAEYLVKTGYKGPIHLMPYNKLAKTKYEKIGRGEFYKDFGDLTETLLESIIKELKKKSFEVVVNH